MALYLADEEMMKELQRKTLKAKETECYNMKGTNRSGTCKPIWDTILCWPETEPGEYETQPCADYFFGFNPKQNATKLCLENGTWMQWTDYSECYESTYVAVIVPLVGAVNDSTVLSLLSVAQDVSTAGYSISLVSLLLAFIIMAFARKLLCPRNILHMHLFFSFIMRAFTTLLKDSLFFFFVGFAHNFVERSGEYYFNQLEEASAWDCKLLYSIWQYFLLANYSLILMEALYIYNLIFKPIFSLRSNIKKYIISGWGLPLLVLIPWIICRIFLENELCWTLNRNEYIYAIINVPVAISNIICFLVFIKILRVVFTKLQSRLCERTQIYRRLAKSALALIPLFGIHYILFLAFDRYSNIGISAEMIFLIIDRIFTSFQGFFVALVYCFLDSEVMTELKNALNKLNHRFQLWYST